MAVHLPLQPAKRAIENAVPTKKIMVHHLSREAALKVKDHRYAQHLADHKPNQRPFVHVGVDHVRSPAEGRTQHRPEKQEIKAYLVWRRTHLVVLPEGDAGRAPNGQASQILSVAIRADLRLMAEFLQNPDFFQDAHRTSIVRKKRRGRYHLDSIGLFSRSLISHGK